MLTFEILSANASIQVLDNLHVILISHQHISPADANYASIIWNPNVPLYPSLALNFFLNQPFSPRPLASSSWCSSSWLSLLSPLDRQSLFGAPGVTGPSLATTLTSLSLLLLSPLPPNNPVALPNVEKVGDLSMNVGENGGDQIALAFPSPPLRKLDMVGDLSGIFDSVGDVAALHPATSDKAQSKQPLLSMLSL